MTTAPPPLPPRSAAEAVAAAPAEAVTRPADRAYDPALDPDDTGVPAPAGPGLLASLFDLSFRTFITRRLASAFYLVGLVAVAIAFLVVFVGYLVRAIALFGVNLPAGIALLVATLVIVPIVTFLAVVLLRFVIEAVVALIAIAENTERTAEHTRR